MIYRTREMNMILDISPRQSGKTTNLMYNCAEWLSDSVDNLAYIIVPNRMMVDHTTNMIGRRIGEILQRVRVITLGDHNSRRHPPSPNVRMYYDDIDSMRNLTGDDIRQNSYYTCSVIEHPTMTHIEHGNTFNHLSADPDDGAEAVTEVGISVVIPFAYRVLDFMGISRDDARSIARQNHHEGRFPANRDILRNVFETAEWAPPAGTERGLGNGRIYDGILFDGLNHPEKEITPEIDEEEAYFERMGFNS